MDSVYKKVVTPLVIIGFVFSLIPSTLAKGVDPEEKVYYYLSDHLGGVDAVLDEEGNVVERRDYLPYGSERMREGNVDEDYGFTGKELDEETGLYYYGARYYDPVIGRFTSLDPLVLGESEKALNSILEDPQALNGYSYVLNNPLKYVDEEGEYGKDFHYDLDYFINRVSGLDYGQAKTVAYYNQFTDENPFTTPLNTSSITTLWMSGMNLMSGITKKIHFAERNTAIGLMGQAIGNKSLEQFGTAKHIFQDTYSHNGLDPYMHMKKGHDPDYTYLAPEKALEAAKASFYFTRAFNATINGIGEITDDEYNSESDRIWSIASTQIMEYLNMEDKTGSDIYNWARESEKREDKKEELKND